MRIGSLGALLRRILGKTVSLRARNVSGSRKKLVTWIRRSSYRAMSSARFSWRYLRYWRSPEILCRTMRRAIRRLMVDRL